MYIATGTNVFTGMSKTTATRQAKPNKPPPHPTVASISNPVSPVESRRDLHLNKKIEEEGEVEEESQGIRKNKTARARQGLTVV